MSDDLADGYTPTKWLDSLVGTPIGGKISQVLQVLVCLSAMTFVASSMGTLLMLEQPSWWIFKFAPFAVFVTTPFSILAGLLYGFWRHEPLGRAGLVLLALASVSLAVVIGYLLPLAGPG